MANFFLGVVLVMVETGIALVFRLGGKLVFGNKLKYGSSVVSRIHIGMLRQISLVMECALKDINDVL